jgi:hypothetical protein
MRRIYIAGRRRVRWRTAGLKLGARVLEAAAIVVIVLIIAAVLLPNINHVKSTPRAAEIKAHLHNVQLLLEK